MLPMSCSDTSVPMEISAANLTSASISSGRISDRSEPATFVRSPRKHEGHVASDTGHGLPPLVTQRSRLCHFQCFKSP